MPMASRTVSCWGSLASRRLPTTGGGLGPASRRQFEDAWLLEMFLKIRNGHEFAGTYGSPRVWLELRKLGVACSRKRIERIMREHQPQGAHLPKGWKTGSTAAGATPAHRRVVVAGGAGGSPAGLVPVSATPRRPWAAPPST